MSISGRLLYNTMTGEQDIRGRYLQDPLRRTLYYKIRMGRAPLRGSWTISGARGIWLQHLASSVIGRRTNLMYTTVVSLHILRYQHPIQRLSASYTVHFEVIQLLVL